MDATARAVAADSSADEPEYDDLRERKEGGYSAQPGEWDDDSDSMLSSDSLDMSLSLSCRDDSIVTRNKQKVIGDAHCPLCSR